jgi:phage gp29-like protein
VTAPTSELGFAGPTAFDRGWRSWWDTLDVEHVPELRWPLSVPVYSRMLTDAQVQSVVRAVTMPILRTQWRLDPQGSRPEVYGPLADDLGLPVVGVASPPRLRTRDRFSWIRHLELALDSLVYGHAVFEPVYRWDEASGLHRLRKLAPRWQSTLEEFHVARDGGLIGIKQGGRLLPVNRLVVYTHSRRGAWQGRSLLRAAYKPWLLKDPAHEVWFQTLIRNGMGIPVYKASVNTDLAKAEAFARSLRSGANAGGALPPDDDLELLAPSGTLPDPNPFVRYLDEQIARAVLAHVLNLGTQTGSWALGSVLADVLTQSLQAEAEDKADTGTQHVVEDWVDYNFGPTEPAPRIVFDPIGAQQAATAQALKMLIESGAIFPDRATEEAIRQRYGLPPKTAPTPVEDS